jgi:hypothetical protein
MNLDANRHSSAKEFANCVINQFDGVVELKSESSIVRLSTCDYNAALL